MIALKNWVRDEFRDQFDRRRIWTATNLSRRIWSRRIWPRRIALAPTQPDALESRAKTGQKWISKVQSHQPVRQEAIASLGSSDDRHDRGLVIYALEVVQDVFVDGQRSVFFCKDENGWAEARRSSWRIWNEIKAFCSEIWLRIMRWSIEWA